MKDKIQNLSEQDRIRLKVFHLKSTFKRIAIELVKIKGTKGLGEKIGIPEQLVKEHMRTPSKNRIENTLEIIYAAEPNIEIEIKVKIKDNENPDNGDN